MQQRKSERATIVFARCFGLAGIGRLAARLGALHSLLGSASRPSYRPRTGSHIPSCPCADRSCSRDTFATLVDDFT
jgi:hypothetical protein